MRLFCFPYAGGGTSIFRNWYQSLPNEFEVVAVLPPGRENRFNEPPISCLSLLVESLYEQIQPLLAKPFVFFGHSNGALTCFELTRALRRNKKPMPDQMILSAKCPPHIAKDSKNISHLADEEFLVELQKIDGTPQSVLQNRELMELFIPMLRADFSLSENFIYQNDILLTTPVSLFYGLKDKITKAQIMAWQDLFASPINTVELSGGHFFIDEQRDQTLLELNRILLKQIDLYNARRLRIASQ